jgi:hypothetical protein
MDRKKNHFTFAATSPFAAEPMVRPRSSKQSQTNGMSTKSLAERE